MPYLWLKALHVLAVMSWMAGMLYLPRLFVYHVAAKQGGELSETLKVMERRLLRFIINPAMVASLLLGAALLAQNPDLLQRPFMHVKLALVLGLLVLHVFLARWRRQFAEDANRHSAKFYRYVNEVPTVLMIGIVVLVVVQPW